MVSRSEVQDHPQVRGDRHYLPPWAPRDWLPADQGMFTKQIDNPRNACGMAMHNFDRRWAEDLPSRVAGDAEPLLDIAMRLEQRQRACFGPKSNALTKLPQLRVVYFFLELRLTGEHDLQEFFRGSLQIRQKPNLFEHVGGQVLRFVDD